MKVNIPGLHNSDQDHWQSRLEIMFPNDFMRVKQENWSEPKCEKWIFQIEHTLKTLNIQGLF